MELQSGVLCLTYGAACGHRTHRSLNVTGGRNEQTLERKPILMHDDFRMAVREPVALPVWWLRTGSEDRTIDEYGHLTELWWSRTIRSVAWTP
jgi:hypothetical protein